MSGSTNVGSIHYDLGLDTSKFDKAMTGMSSKLKNVGSKMSSVGKSMTLGMTLPIVAGAALAVKAASDLNENINKVGVAFKKNAKQVMDWSKTSISSMGLAQSSALEAASLFGDMATSMGLSTQKAAKMSTSLVQLGADLASFKNISFEEAQTALAGVFTGETESLKRLGIVMTEVNLLEYAKQQGITKTIQEMTQSEKVQLRYNYIMAKTANAQGDFIRTGGGTANQIRITQEKFKQLSATLGAQLLPIANRVLGVLQKFMDRISKLSQKQQTWLLRILAVTAAIGPLLIIVGKLTSAIGALLPLLANPTFLIVAAVLAVIAGVAYLVYKNWDKIKPTVDKVIAGFQVFWALIKPIRDFVVTQFIAAWRDLQRSFEDLKRTMQPYMPQLIMLGKVLLGVSLLITATFIVALVAITVVVARVIGWIAKFIAWFVKAQMGLRNFASSVANSMVQAHNAVVNRIGSIINTIRSIPGRVRNALGNLGGLLYGAGTAIIQGFYNGIVNKFNSVKGFVSGIASWIRDHKGPISYDKKLLIPQGKAILSGFNKGLLDGWKNTEKIISGMTGNISAGARRPEPVTSGGSGGSMSIYGNINIGNKSDADYFFSRMNRNQTLSTLGVAPVGGM